MQAPYTPTQISFQKQCWFQLFLNTSAKVPNPSVTFLNVTNCWFSQSCPPPLYNHAEGSDNTKDTRGLTVLSVHRFICAAVIPIWAGRLSTKGTVIYCFRASAAWSMIYLQPGSNESFSIRWMRRTHCRLPLCCSVIHRPAPFTVRIW